MMDVPGTFTVRPFQSGRARDCERSVSHSVTLGLLIESCVSNDVPVSGSQCRDHLRGCALIGRKRVLAPLLEKATGPIKYSEHLDEDGPRVFDKACGLELEDVISKRVDGKCEPGRTHYWTKTRGGCGLVLHCWAGGEGRDFDGIYLGKSRAAGWSMPARWREVSPNNRMRISILHKKLKTKTAHIIAGRQFPKARWMKSSVRIDAEYRGTKGKVC
jgi:hypothetical protein